MIEVEFRMCLIKYSSVLEVVHRQLGEFFSPAVCSSDCMTSGT